ncbi:MAG TPA: porin, partial [Armatimonadota bacterium]|nr:porin [Armatimonadota bacterium]
TDKAAPAAPQPPAPSVPAVSPASPDVEKRLRELEETVRRQQELIQRLEGTVELLRKPAPPTPPAADMQPKPKPAAPEGFVIQGPDSGFRLRLRGLIQADARAFPSEGGRTGTESFLVRRIRTVFSGTVGRHAEFMIQPIFDENRLGVLDAYVDVRQAPQLQFRFGLFKTPFSLERLQPAADLHLIERSIAQNLAPNRDTGFMVHGDTLKGRLSYALAVLNGAPDAGNIYGDTGRGKDFAGRIFARPFTAQKGRFLQGLGLGVAATYGSRDETFQSIFRTAAREPFFLYGAGTLYAGDVVRIAPQFYHFYRQFGVMGEAYLNRERLSRAGMVAPVNHRGWFLQGTYVLTGENAGFRSLMPRRPFDPARGHWGAVELALRYSQFRADQDAFRLELADPTVSARRADAWTFGVNWYLTNLLKFQVNYERTDFNRAITFRTGPRDREDIVLSRFQLAF